MKETLKKMIRNKYVIILLVFLVLSFVFINPTTGDGVAIRGVARDSAAAEAAPMPINPPDPQGFPRAREVITEVNGVPVNNVEEYYDLVSQFNVNETFSLTTRKGSAFIPFIHETHTYFITPKPDIEVTVLNETETVYVNETVFDELLNETVTVEMPTTRNKTIEEVVGVQDIGLIVYDKPNNNIRQGLDLAGGTRVMLEPEEEVSPGDLDLIVDNIERRLDVFGVSDVTVRTTTDLFGNNFISVEIAGADEQEVQELLAREGKFEAKIGDEVVFTGGDRDILVVHRTADRAGIEPGSCGQTSPDEWACRFRFSITLSREAAERQARITQGLDIVSVGLQQNYLSENLTLYLDDVLVDELRISADLQGRPATDIQITGTGVGNTRQAAINDALTGMRELQTLLVTGSLPVNLEIVKTDTISPVLGAGFIRNALLAGLVAILTVIIIIAIRYREWRVSIPMSIAMLSEVTIILGFASLIGWNIDMAAIAAIIITIGSGVDHQILIADETLSKKRKREPLSWAEKLKRAFFIIMAAYFTLVVAMIPLWFAGAGLLKGFALTTIAGVTIGVLVTRPAYAAILEALVDKK